MDDVSFLTPVVGEVAFGVFYYSNSYAGELNGLPKGGTAFSFVLGFGDGVPVYCLEGDGGHNFSNMNTVFQIIDYSLLVAYGIIFFNIC